MAILTAAVLLAVAARGDEGLRARVEHARADSDRVEIHYVALGKGPLVVMIHGFPDYWYSWRGLMDAVAENHRVVAMDLRGYNRSGRPKGVEKYAMPLLVADVEAVLRAEGRKRATIVGHDWGGAIAWSFAMTRPEKTERLVILNLPHPRGMARELVTNPEQRRNSDYAQKFRREDSHLALRAEGLASWVRDPDARARYVEAFRRSDFEAMMSYYRANYPALPEEGEGAVPSEPPTPVRCPVLMFHGLEDPFLLHDGLCGTWEWIDADLTLVTIPGAGHFVHHDAPDLVRRTLTLWLER